MLNDKTINNLKNVAKLVKTKSRYAYTGNSLKNARKMDNVRLKPGQKCAKNAKVSRLT